MRESIPLSRFLLIVGVLLCLAVAVIAWLTPVPLSDNGPEYWMPKVVAFVTSGIGLAVMTIIGWRSGVLRR